MKKFPRTKKKKKNGKRKKSKQRVDWAPFSNQFTPGSHGTRHSDLSRLEFIFVPVLKGKLCVSEARKIITIKKQKRSYPHFRAYKHYAKTGRDSSGVQIAATVCHVRQANSQFLYMQQKWMP